LIRRSITLYSALYCAPGRKVTFEAELCVNISSDKAPLHVGPSTVAIKKQLGLYAGIFSYICRNIQLYMQKGHNCPPPLEII
jgi:hypothetical protein